jgi:hypothetical protein
LSCFQPSPSPLAAEERGEAPAEPVEQEPAQEAVAREEMAEWAERLA